MESATDGVAADDVQSALNLLGSAVEWRAGAPVLLPHALAHIAAGTLPSPSGCPRQLDDALRIVHAGIATGSASASVIAVDFSKRPATDAGRSTGPAPEIAPHIRCVAFGHARRIWNHAIEVAVPQRIAARGDEAWHCHVDEHWRSWSPEGHRYIEQGWKLHVSATPNSAPEVLAACADVLLEHRIAFKHAASIEQVEALTSAKCERGHGGKFITIYPGDEQQARELAHLLDRATRGFGGPEILSDKRLHQASQLYYRYGVISAKPRLGNDGAYQSRLQAPDGTWSTDQRNAWFEAPPWVTPLFPGEAPKPRSDKPKRVLLNDRYLVTGAIHHANRGGVYRGVDQATGSAVIVKQARPHTAAELTGYDATDALRKESRNLELLDGIAPAHVDLFEYQGHLFLVQSEIPGKNLRDWLFEKCDESTDARPAISPTRTLELAVSVCRLLEAIKRKGLVCRDFNPNNIMVSDDGSLRIIDTELMDHPGSFVYRYYTYGFGAPELIGGERGTLCPDFSADAYSLGATLYHLVTGNGPPIHLHNDSAESLATRWRIAIAQVEAAGFAQIGAIIEQLIRIDASDRITVEEAARRITALLDANARGNDHPRSVACKAEALPSFRRLVVDGTRHILATRRSSGSRLWHSGTFGSTVDECSIQHGAAGVLGYLCQLDECEDIEVGSGALRAIADWIAARISSRESLLPGLYFGASGSAWACTLAAAKLHDDALQKSAIEWLLRLPTAWPNPDVCHGLAGAGLALCNAWHHSGDARLLERIDASADELLATMREDPAGISWTVDENFDSSLKGITHYGFAHGIAGIAYFLMMAGVVLGRGDCIAAAEQAGDTLLRAAERGPFGARWRSKVGAVGNARSDLQYYWCSGSTGIGTFLVRLWHLTGRTEFRDYAVEAAAAAHWVRWHSGPSVCHGLAGNGEFLLDMARFVDLRHADQARDLAHCLLRKTTSMQGAILVVDESETAVTVDYNTGLSGALAFLDRLDTHKPRLWMLDGLLPPTATRAIP